MLLDAFLEEEIRKMRVNWALLLVCCGGLNVRDWKGEWRRMTGDRVTWRRSLPAGRRVNGHTSLAT